MILDKRTLLLPILAAALLSGCATSRSMIELPSTPVQANQASPAPNGKEVYVQAARDKRTFQVNPPVPSIPSLDPSEAQSDSIKLRAIGRKRNSFGKALGDILLPEHDSVESRIIAAIRRAYTEKGYKVLDKREDVTPKTHLVDADITQFWTWLNPGFWALTISAEIATDLTIKSPEATRHPVVQVKAADNFQTGLEGNFSQVVSQAVDLYVGELKNKIQ